MTSISNSNALYLSAKEWVVTMVLVVLISGIIYYGWNTWEAFNPGPDYRETCWGEKNTDYWAHFRWSRFAAQSDYKVFLIGDSVIWGQEVNNDQTISHFLNAYYGDEIFANLGIDALFQAAFPGLFAYYGKYYSNVILQFNPHWLRDLDNDLRGRRKRFYHPRLVSQFNPHIHYNDYTLNERLGYKLENYVGLFALVHHIMVNYYENKSISSWMIANPYRNPFTAITFNAVPVMAKSQGKSLDWKTKKQKITSETFVDLSESIHWESFLEALTILRKRGIRFFVLLGPYNTYMLTPESRENLQTIVDGVKKRLDIDHVPYFDTMSGFLPSETFADDCHLLRDGHDLLARELLKDASFTGWLTHLRE
jgi:hypothetical protein